MQWSGRVSEIFVKIVGDLDDVPPAVEDLNAISNTPQPFPSLAHRSLNALHTTCQTASKTHDTHRLEQQSLRKSPHSATTHHEAFPPLKSYRRNQRNNPIVHE